MGDLDFNTLRQICVWDKEEKGKVVRPLSTQLDKLLNILWLRIYELRVFYPDLALSFGLVAY
jgi:hypothetical protein